MSGAARCSIHPDVDASGACDRCGRFMCRPCTYPLPGPFGKMCLLCVEDQIFPEAKAALNALRNQISIIGACATVVLAVVLAIHGGELNGPLLAGSLVVVG